jgi:hypothetical protein
MFKCFQFVTLILIVTQNGSGEILQSKLSNTRLILKVEDCISHLKLEENRLGNSTALKNWNCRIKYKKPTNLALFCSCFYDYECNEARKFFFSYNYNQHFLSLNRMNKIERGADYQCETYLMRVTKNKWKCELKENKEMTNLNDKDHDDNQSYYCECLNKKMCKFNRLVELDSLKL